MNRLEDWFCGSSLWKRITRDQLLPWLLSNVELGDHVLELGAGPGATTGELRQRVRRVTSLKYDHRFAAPLGQRQKGTNGTVVQGDAAALPFPDRSFSSVTAILMLHHLKSPELQRNTFREVRRVLKPNGLFLAFEIENSWLHRVLHIRSTFVPVDPRSVSSDLAAAGFQTSTVDRGSGGFRILASFS